MRKIGDNELFERKKSEEKKEVDVTQDAEWIAAEQRAMVQTYDKELHEEEDLEDEDFEEEEFDEEDFEDEELDEEDLEDDYEYSSGGMDLSTIAVGLLVLAIMVAIGSTFLMNVASFLDDGNVDPNITSSVAENLSSTGSFFELFIVVGVVSLIIGLILTLFKVFRSPSGLA